MIMRLICRIFGHDFGIGGAAWYDGQCFRCGVRSAYNYNAEQKEKP